MSQGQLLSVTFHYVGMPETPCPGIHGLSATQFRKAIEQLRASWSIVSLNDILDALDGKSTLPKKSCLISLDDGLKCQFDVALPILDDMGVPGAFFVLGGPYIQKKAATVHQLHTIRAYHGDQTVIDTINRILTGDDNSKGLHTVDQVTASQHYRYDSPESAKLKYYLNYHSTPQFTKQVMDAAFDEVGIDEKEFIHDFYMSESMIKDLGGRGYLGSHAQTHLPLATLDTNRIREELSNTRNFLESVSGTQVTAISYPLGNAQAVNQEVGRLAEQTGHRVGWTMERAINQSLADPLLLGRLDAADRDSIDQFGPRQRYFPRSDALH